MKKIDVVQPIAMTSAFANGVYSASSTNDFEIPASTSTSASDTCVQDNGFLPITSIDLDNGGIAPERKNFNGLFYLSTDQRFYLQNGGFITYSASVATAIGGYPQDAILDFIDSNGMYKKVRSLIDDNVNNFVSDESLIDGVHWEEITMGGSSRNIGEIVPSTIPLTDAGLHLLDGSLLAYGSYKDFIDYIAELYNSGDYSSIFTTEANWQTSVTTYDVCDKFVYDSVNNTVRLPKTSSVHGQLIKKSTNGSSGYRIYADGYCEQWGINTNNTPTIVLSISYINTDYNIQASNTKAGNHYENGGIDNKTVSGFRFNWGYTGCYWKTTGYVDVSSYQQNPRYEYIVIANTTKTQIQVDIDEIATDLNGKADVDLTNVNNSGTSRGASWAMPSSTYDNLTLGASGTTYTAPANGWFAINKIAGATSRYVAMGNTTSGLYITQNANLAEMHCVGFLPVLKNDEISVEYDATGATQSFRFYYAKGSESEAQ